MDERIKVTVKNGIAKIETSGFAGSACQKATERLSKALGTSVQDTPTAEMFTVPVILDQEQGQ